MFKFFLALALALHAVCASAAVKPYPADVSTWKEITVPESEEEREVWRYAANDSEIAWRVYTEGTIVKAKLDDSSSRKAGRDTRFVIAAEPLSGFSKHHSPKWVTAGWLAITVANLARLFTGLARTEKNITKYLITRSYGSFKKIMPCMR